jgi:hypothetical protein
MYCQLSFGQNQDSLRFEKLVLKDTIFLNNQFDNALVYIHSNGLIETKTSFIESIKTGKIIYQKFTPINRKTIQEKNTQINTGEVSVDGIIEENAFSVKLKYTSIYKRRKNNWKLIYWQSTKIK